MKNKEAISREIRTVAANMVKKPFKKHQATIFMRGNLSSLDRKLWNLVTKNAFFELGKKQRHTVDLDVLCEAAGYDSKDLKPIKAAFETLTTTSISWIRQDDEGGIVEDEEWVTTSFLSGAKIKGKTITYEYSSFLSERLAEPEMYARINLTSQKNLSKGRSLPLYEITAAYRENGSFPGKTKLWSLEYFRALMGAESEYYDQFKRLKNKIIDPNIKKVNEETDIFIEATFHKTGRRYSGIQFTVKNNPQMPLFSQADYESVPVFQRLVNHGISVLQAEKFLSEHTEDYLEKKLALLERKLSEGKVKSPSGFLVKAIKEDYDHSDPEADRKALEEESKKKKREIAEKKKREEEKQKSEAESAAQDLAHKAQSLLSSLNEEETKALKERFEKEVIADHFLSSAYQKSGLEHLMVKGFWHDYVVQNAKIAQ